MRKQESIDEAISVLQRLSDVFERRRQQLAREAGLTDAQWRVLEQIGHETFMPSLFAREREAHPAAVSRVLRQLQERGWATARISASDARQRDYRLSASGRRVLAQLRASRSRAIDAVWSDLPAAELMAFARFGRRLAERLERYAERTGKVTGGRVVGAGSAE